jgi:hypothetical protein
VTNNPGSDEAVAQGCTCPVLDNGRGRGAHQVNGVWQFWINWGCPVHTGLEPLVYTTDEEET